MEKKIKTFGAPQKAYAKLVNRQAKEAFYNAQDCVKGIADNFFLGTPRDECATALSWTKGSHLKKKLTVIDMFL